MLGSKGNQLNANLTKVMYVPGLSRRLFSVTQFAQHGHRAIVQQHSTTLLFGQRRSQVTIPYKRSERSSASKLSVLSPENSSNKHTYHQIPAYRN
jgi:hypothetical protein